MNYYGVYQQQGYDPSSQNQQLYYQSSNNYYAYSYANPQYTTVHPYPHPNFAVPVQQTQPEEQEPNPPGVTPTQPAELGLRSIYPPTVGPQQGTVDTAVANVQSSYSTIGIVSSVAPAPGGEAHAHLHPTPNVPQQSYHVLGHGSVGALQMNPALVPLQNQAVYIHGGSNIPGGPPQAQSQSYAESHFVLGQNNSGRSIRGRGRGRGKGRSLHKHAAASARNQKIINQSRLGNQGGPSQPLPQSDASNIGQISTPLQAPAQSIPVLPPSKAVCCELCRVECNTAEILEQHINGKKHKKKLKVFEELQNVNKRAIHRKLEQTSTSELKPESSQPVQVEGSVNQQLEQEILPTQAVNEETTVAIAIEEPKPVVVETAEESVSKVRVDRSGGAGRGMKRKMRGGKGGRRMKPFDRSRKLVEPSKPKELIPLVCELCNVKCESSVVFQCHLVGKKHLSKAKRFLGSQEAVCQEPLQPQAPAVQALNVNASTSVVSQVQDQGAPAQYVMTVNVQPSTTEATAQP